MNDQELISIIVPVYRAEKYLANCLNSLICQEYSNIEIILVVDGSPDNSLAICREFASRDERILVVEQENQGVSAARNHGMERAAGRYITFVDSDDYIAPDYLAVLHRDIVNSCADVVCCDYIEVVNDRIWEACRSKIRKSRLLERGDELFNCMTGPEETFWSCVWGKLFRSDLAKQCRFKALKFGEDQVYFYDICLLQPTVYLDTYKGYYYVRNEDSATVQSGEYGIAKCWDEVRMDRYCYENYPGSDGVIRGRFFMQYVYKMQRQVRITLLSGDAAVRKEQAPALRNEIRSVLGMGEKMPLKSRVYFYLYLCAPCLLRKMLQAQKVE